MTKIPKRYWVIMTILALLGIPYACVVWLPALLVIGIVYCLDAQMTWREAFWHGAAAWLLPWTLIYALYKSEARKDGGPDSTAATYP